MWPGLPERPPGPRLGPLRRRKNPGSNIRLRREEAPPGGCGDGSTARTPSRDRAPLGRDRRYTRARHTGPPTCPPPLNRPPDGRPPSGGRPTRSRCPPVAAASGRRGRVRYVRPPPDPTPRHGPAPMADPGDSPPAPRPRVRRGQTSRPPRFRSLRGTRAPGHGHRRSEPRRGRRAASPGWHHHHP